MSRFAAQTYTETLNALDPMRYCGTVTQLVGLALESAGPVSRIGDMCRVYSPREDSWTDAEVVGFRDNRILLMPFGKLAGIGPGCRVEASGHGLRVRVGPELRGRILDGLGNPIDGLGPLRGKRWQETDNPPPSPLSRSRISKPLPFGVKSLDGLLTCGRGQRIGIFAGSGVGKSTLMGMIARHAQADINVITLVGERGREVREFIEKDLRTDGLAKSVLVVATSDQPALVRQKSAMLGTAIAEYFRDQGLDVLLLMDSLTRFAMAQREIGMSVGEPPVSRGYTPSVFQVLPRLLERSGNAERGSVTGLYTVLVEGDDMNEPVADTVRGILDGHIVLSRKLAHRNHYPAVDVLSSVSRIMPDITTPRHLAAAGFLRRNLSVYQDAQDLIHIGAYKKGASAEIDEAVRLNAGINAFLRQDIGESVLFEDTIDQLVALAESEA